MATVLPFARKEGGRIPQALTESRLRTIAGLEDILHKLLGEAYEDLGNGMPYLDTDLRLLPSIETRLSVVNASCTRHISRAAGT